MAGISLKNNYMANKTAKARGILNRPFQPFQLFQLFQLETV
jgi:hypothetical protein